MSGMSQAIVPCYSIEYKSLGKDPSEARQVESSGSSGDSSSSQHGQSHVDTATAGDKAALHESQHQDGGDDQPSLAFFPADHTGYIAKVRSFVSLTAKPATQTATFSISIRPGQLSILSGRPHRSHCNSEILLGFDSLQLDKQQATVLNSHAEQLSLS